jgi:hypothetical protein
MSTFGDTFRETAIWRTVAEQLLLVFAGDPPDAIRPLVTDHPNSPECQPLN